MRSPAGWPLVSSLATASDSEGPREDAWAVGTPSLGGAAAWSPGKTWSPSGWRRWGWGVPFCEWRADASETPERPCGRRLFAKARSKESDSPASPARDGHSDAIVQLLGKMDAAPQPVGPKATSLVPSWWSDGSRGSGRVSVWWPWFSSQPQPLRRVGTRQVVAPCGLVVIPVPWVRGGTAGAGLAVRAPPRAPGAQGEGAPLCGTGTGLGPALPDSG